MMGRDIFRCKLQEKKKKLGQMEKNYSRIYGRGYAWLVSTRSRTDKVVTPEEGVGDDGGDA